MESVISLLKKLSKAVLWNRGKVVKNESILFIPMPCIHTVLWVWLWFLTAIVQSSISQSSLLLRSWNAINLETMLLHGSVSMYCTCQAMEEIRGHSPIHTTAHLALCKRVSLINFRIVSNEKQRQERLLVNMKLLTVDWGHFALGERQKTISLAQSWLESSNDTRKYRQSLTFITPTSAPVSGPMSGWIPPWQPEQKAST